MWSSVLRCAALQALRAGCKLSLVDADRLTDTSHSPAVNCILFWATRKEAAWCPQCRVKFSQLTLYRKLDGEPRELPAQESLCLLKRTAWFQEYAQVGTFPGLGDKAWACV